MPVTIKQIEAFHAVMVSGGMTRAAKMLGVSQPAISRIVGDLEKAVGFPLFLRSARTLKPTTRARHLYREVERSFHGLEHIAAVARLLKEGEEGHLRLAVIPSLVPYVSESLIGDFLGEHPSVPVSIEVAASLDQLDWTGSGPSDVGITAEPVMTRGLSARPIGETEAAAVVSSRHRLAAGTRRLAAHDFAGEAFVCYMPGSAFRSQIDRHFEAEGVRRDVRLEARTTAAVCELVATCGATTIISTAGPHVTADRRLVVRPFAPAIASAILLVTPRERPLPAVAQAFVDFACARAGRGARHVDAGRGHKGDTP